MSRIYYSYRNWSDAQGNNYSLSFQIKNYPELFSPIAEGLPAVAKISENFINPDKYRGGDRLGYIDINDELLAKMPIDIDYINRTLERIGSILNLDIIEDIEAWIARYTSLEKTDQGYEIYEGFGDMPGIYLKV